jgi:hypothetical protein
MSPFALEVDRSPPVKTGASYPQSQINRALKSVKEGIVRYDGEG